MSTVEEYAVEAEGIAGAVTVRPATLFGRPQLLVDGAPARPGPRRGTFHLPGADGRDREASFAAELMNVVPVLVIEGRRHEVGPKVPVPLLLLAAAPFGLVTVGGLIGGLCGGIAVAINFQIARAPWPWWIQVLAMVAIGGSAGIAFVVLATAAALALQ